MATKSPRSPSLQTRGKRFAMVAGISMAGLALLNTAANRNIPVLSSVAQTVRGIVTKGV